MLSVDPRASIDLLDETFRSPFFGAFYCCARLGMTGFWAMEFLGRVCKSCLMDSAPTWR